MLEKILNKIKESKNILITSHINPDADAVCSVLLMKEILLNLDITNTKIILHDFIPENLEFLDEEKVIEKFDYENKSLKFDLVICLDSATYSRIGKIKKMIDKNTSIINIDHHISNEKYGNLNFILKNCASNTIVIYKMLKEMNMSINKKMAKFIFAGIVGDTGNFVYGNTDETALKVASEMLKFEIDQFQISRKVYFDKSLDTIKLMSIAINNMKYFEKYNMLYSFISNKNFQDLNTKNKDAEGIIDILSSAREPEFVLFLKETDRQKIKGSLRSKTMDVIKIAEIFNGGGHKNAAGFWIEHRSLEYVFEKIIFFLEKNWQNKSLD